MIRNISDVQTFNEFVVIIIYVNEIINDNSKIQLFVIVVIIRQIYLIDDLKIKILIKNDIIIFEKLLFNFKRQKIKINNCRKLKILFNIKIRQSSSIKKIVRFRFKITIFFHKIVDVFIIVKSFFLIEIFCLNFFINAI